MPGTETEKIILPIRPSQEIMSLLIKANNLLSHANKHSEQKSDFDIMIAIHSLDNAIEYILRIVIKHLDIEDKLGKTINTMELMGLFGDVNSFTKDYTIFEDKPFNLPYKNEIRQLRILRNSVQHGMILPIRELNDIAKYANRFFEKILLKIFGLSRNQISYAILIINPDLRGFIQSAEEEIEAGKFLDAIVSARSAFELGHFIFRDSNRRTIRSPALASIKFDSSDLYYYLKYIDDELSMLSSKINMDEYRRFKLYMDHIPSEFNAQKSGHTVLQREWEREDAIFCCNFVSSVILSWQLDGIEPLYEIDTSTFPVMTHEKTINEIVIPELYPEKCCTYAYGDLWGELFFLSSPEIETLGALSPKDVIKYGTRITNSVGAVWRSYVDFRIINTFDKRVILNNPTLWEIVVFYRSIPFTEIDEAIPAIELSQIETSPLLIDYEYKDTIVIFVAENGSIDTIEKAFALDKLIENHSDEYRLISTPLIENLSVCIIDKTEILD